MNQHRASLVSASENYTPIRMLNNFATDWKIKARVIKKN